MSATRRQRLLAIGAVHIDDTATPLGPLVEKASNPVRWTRHIGGVCANALCAARRQSSTLDIDFVAAVGDDAIASVLTEALQRRSINTRFVTLENTETGRYSVILDHLGELFIGLADVDNAVRVALDDICNHAGEPSPDAVLLDTNLHPDTITALARHVSAEWQCPLIGLAVSPAKVLKLLPMRDQFSLLICNRREAIALLNAGNPSLSVTEHTPSESLAHALIDLGFGPFILTDGAEPVFVYEDNQLTDISVPPLTIESSVNGAGDAMAGATLARWLTGTSLCDSVRAAGLPAARRILSGERTPQRL